MSVTPSPARDDRAALDAVAGLMAASAIFVSLVAVAYRPVRIIPFAVVLALVAAGIGGRNARLAAVAVAVAGACFVAGTAVAVLTQNPLY